MNGWKVLDVASLVLLSAILAGFTYIMVRSVVDDGAAVLSGSSLIVIFFASTLLHVTIALAAATLGSLVAVVYRIVH